MAGQKIICELQENLLYYKLEMVDVSAAHHRKNVSGYLWQIKEGKHFDKKEEKTF
jgi:hypothetical protein